MLFTILALALGHQVFSYDFDISATGDNSLRLTGSDCKELTQQHKAICAWKKTIEPEFVIPNLTEKSCLRISRSKVSVSVSNCLPKFVKENHHKKVYRSGANCWGTAMNFKGISNTPRFVWGNEMRYWQQSSGLCRKLEAREALMPGDIINTYGPEYIFSSDHNDKGTLFWEALYPNRYTPQNVDQGYSGYHNFLHSETYISDKLTFGKDSPSKDDRFEFHHMIEVYGRSRDKDCQENQSLVAHEREFQKLPRKIKGTKCDYFSVTYRCENVKSYLEKQNLNPIEEDILEEVRILKGIQDDLFKLQVSSSNTLSKEDINSILASSDHMAQMALLDLSRGELSKNEEFLLTLKFFTAQGIRKSLELANLTLATEPL